MSPREFQLLSKADQNFIIRLYAIPKIGKETWSLFVAKSLFSLKNRCEFLCCKTNMETHVNIFI